MSSPDKMGVAKGAGYPLHPHHNVPAVPGPVAAPLEGGSTVGSRSRLALGRLPVTVLGDVAGGGG
ncbi:MAG: hypothetical protein ACREP9_03585 [Candidatus Dormibacteraceae bacterium]